MSRDELERPFTARERRIEILLAMLFAVLAAAFSIA
jgi:hypothetical protein